MKGTMRGGTALNNDSTLLFVGTTDAGSSNGFYALDALVSRWGDGPDEDEQGGTVLGFETIKSNEQSNVGCGGTPAIASTLPMVFIGCDDGLHAYSYGSGENDDEASSKSNFFTELW